MKQLKKRAFSCGAAVLEKDVFQDVATIEVERDSNNRVQVQVVGDVYMYGTNYIYEPVYVHTPIIYTTFE